MDCFRKLPEERLTPVAWSLGHKNMLGSQI